MLAVITGLLLLAFCAPAYAGVETLLVATVTSLLTAVGVSAAAAAVAAPVLTAAIIIGGALAAQSLFGRAAPGDTGLGAQAATVDPGRARDTFESSESPELRAVGRVRLGGLKAFGNTNGANRYRETLHCKGEIDGFEAFYFGGREIVAEIDGSGAVSSYPWATPGSSWSFLLVKKGDGAEAAWPWLLSDFPDIYTADHRARGICQSLACFVNPGFSNDKFLQLYQGGVPDVEALIRAEKAYDPRTTSTAWTENGIVNALHILLSTYREMSLADIDIDFVSTEADRADALIATLAGNVARSRCWGIWSSESARGANMQKVLDSIGARIVPRDGGYKIGIQLVDDDPAPEVTILLRHIVAVDWQSGPSGVERPNICRPKYYAPERNFELAEIDMSAATWARIDDEVTAYGEKYLDLEYPFCPNSGQAQRNARRDFALARTDSGVIKTNMAGLAVWGCRIVAFEFPDDLGTIRCKIGAPRILDDQGLIEIPFQVWPALEPWNPDIHEAPAPDQIPELAYGSPLTTPDAPFAATVVTYQGGLGTVTRVGYSLPGGWSIVEATYRKYFGSNPLPWVGLTEVSAGGFTHAYVAANETGQKADFRVRIFDANDNGSNWSTLLSVPSLAVDNTAPGAPLFYAAFSGMPMINLYAYAPNSLNVAYMSCTGIGAPTVNAIRPRESIPAWSAILSRANNHTFQVTPRSTNGTAGPAATIRASYDAVLDAPQLMATAVAGSGRIDVSWSRGYGPVTHFTGPGAPPDSTDTDGVWSVTGLGSGTYTITADDGATASSIDITI